MKRIVSTVRVVGLLALASILVVAPVPVASVAYAEHVTEQVLMDQLGKVKAMIAEMEMKMKTKKMMMSHKGMDQSMDMLMEITRILQEIERPK